MVSSTVLVSTHTTPTGMPPSRARPTTTVSAQGFMISSKEPVSKNPVWNCLVSGEQRGTHKHQHGSFLSFPGTQQLLVSQHYPLTSPYTSTIHSFSHHTHPPVILFLLHIHPPVIHLFSITSNNHSSPHTSAIHSFLSHTYSPSIHFHNSVISFPLYPPFITSSPCTSTTHHLFSIHIHHSSSLLHPHP